MLIRGSTRRVRKRTAEIQFARGNRLATLMVYLSNVEAGGGTAFPDADVVSFPGKGKSPIFKTSS